MPCEDDTGKGRHLQLILSLSMLYKLIALPVASGQDSM